MSTVISPVFSTVIFSRNGCCWDSWSETASLSLDVNKATTTKIANTRIFRSYSLCSTRVFDNGRQSTGKADGNMTVRVRYECEFPALSSYLCWIVSRGSLVLCMTYLTELRFPPLFSSVNGPLYRSRVVISFIRDKTLLCKLFIARWLSNRVNSQYRFKPASPSCTLRASHNTS